MAQYRVALAQHARSLLTRAARDRWYSVEGGDLSQPVLIRLGITSDGVWAATAVLMGLEGEPQGITTRAQRLRLAEIVEALVKSLGYRKQRWPRPHRASSIVRAQSIGELLGHYQQGADVVAPRVRPGKKPKPDAFYREVARQYRQAMVQDPRRPMRVLYAMRSEPQRTVKFWVGVARKKGLLGKWTAPAKKVAKRRRAA